MFSGIVTAIGTIEELEKNRGGARLAVAHQSVRRRAHAGGSVAIDGVCLTIAAMHGTSMAFDLLPETLAKTTFGAKSRGRRVNIEWPLRAGEEISGHFVYGHIDGVGKIISRVKKGKSLLLTISAPAPLRKYILPQGSVAIDGVGLTVAQSRTNAFAVSLTSYTQTHTTLGHSRVGDRVNVECDMLAKFVGDILERKYDSKRKSAEN